jgi:hypothetical protein
MAFLKARRRSYFRQRWNTNHIGSFTFVNDAAIDFDRVKYKFTAVECVDENK